MRRHSSDRDVIVVEPDGGSSVGWLLLGAAVGAGMALLFAPASGAETRRRISRSARRLKETAADALDEIRDEFDDLTDKASEKLDEVKEAAGDTVEAIEDTTRGAIRRGRSGAAQAREELERRLADARARRRAEAEDQEPVA
jgi:gas vesicle protein